MNSKQYIVAVEGAIVRAGRYLMVVRSMEESHAPGALAWVGGKVEQDGNSDDVLENTLRREIQEEVGLTVGQIVYAHSTNFTTDYGDPVVDIIFLCQYESGQPTIIDPGEVAAIRWVTTAEIMQDSTLPIWVHRSMEHVEALRTRLGW